MGALIVSRHPGHRLGWLLCVGSLISVTVATEAYSVACSTGDVPGSAYWAHVSAWVSSLLGWPAFTAVVMVFLLAPDGRLLSRRWRWAVWVTSVGLAAAHAWDPDDRPRGVRLRRAVRRDTASRNHSSPSA